MGTPLSATIGFLVGALLTVAVAHPPLRRRLLQQLRVTAGRGRDELKRAVPDGADDLFVAGWSFAGGAFFSLLLANVGPIITSSDPWIPTAAMVAFGAVVIPLTIYLHWVHRHTLTLNHSWPLVVWSHYRPLVARLASMVRPAGSLDFVTHRGADLPERLLPSGLADLSYGSCLPNDTAAMIVDVEALSAIESSGYLGPQMRLVQLDALIGDDAIVRQIRESAVSKKLFMDDHEATSFFPIRWGFNSLAIRVGDPEVAQAIRDEYMGAVPQPIDLFDFFTNSSHPLRSRLSVCDPDCPLVAFDWHLPAMMLLVQSACGRAAWTRPDTESFSARMSTLLEGVAKWLEVSPTSQALAGRTPLIRDVVQMQQTIRSAGVCVILGGGNFLWARDGGLTPENVVCLPVRSDGTGHCLLWCEVLALLAPESKQGDQMWRRDAQRLLKQVQALLPGALAQMPFHGFSAQDHGVQLDASTCEEAWRRFALERGHLRHSHANSHWKAEWEALRQQVLKTVPSGQET